MFAHEAGAMLVRDSNGHTAHAFADVGAMSTVDNPTNPNHDRGREPARVGEGAVSGDAARTRADAHVTILRRCCPVRRLPGQPGGRDVAADARGVGGWRDLVEWA